jgi:predicted molibdopterin-dependent oxidoreductase YjgC
VKVFVISGDEALANPDVRALAEQAEHVIAMCMFATAARGLADLILPGTSYLERDGTYVNLEGRVQRLRRAVVPPVPDELAWLSKLADRFGVHVSPYPASIFEELSALLYDGMPFGEIGETAQLHPRKPAEEPLPAPEPEPRTGGMRLVAYRPLFAGPAVERTPELQFQRPEPELELARGDAERLGIRNGDEVDVRSNGTSVRLRARLSRTVRPGVVRAAQEHVTDLQQSVEVKRA